jgi:MarR family 2-MHQ and catechol resistance regulon transcriptional repressor
MGTHYKGPAGVVRALDAYIKLMRAAGSVSARLAGFLTEVGLTTSQFGALEALLHLGPMGQCDLAAKLLQTGGNITMVVNNLERRGLVRRRRLGRRVEVQLTPRGRRLIVAIFPRHARNIAREMGVLRAAGLAELGRLCKKIGKKEALCPKRNA